MLVLVMVVGARAAGAAEHQFIAAGDTFEYASVAAPHPGEEVGTRSITALVRRRGGGAGTEAAGAEAAVPLAWLSGAAPFGSKDDSLKPATALTDPAGGRVAALHLRRKFTVDKAAARVRILELRVRYRDALVARVNGIEIARRNLAAGAASTAYSERTHGPEWETFYIACLPGLIARGENVLEIEVRPNVHRMAPAVDVALVGADQASVVRGPLVQRVGETTATIVFETDLPTRAEVRFGAAASAYDRRAAAAGLDAAEPITRHVVELTGLEPDAEVHYQVVTSTEKGADAAFHTTPRAGDPVRFVVYGDVRSGHDLHAQILAAIETDAPDFLLATGDMVLRGSDEADWQRFFAVAGATLARVPLYPVLGNHDRGKSGDRDRRFEDIFELWPAPAERPEGGGWYSFDVAGVHVAVIDSHAYEDAAQLAWLDADLAAARERGAKALFAATHHGPWSRGPHGGHAVAVRDWVPILEKHGVAVIFSGHDHLYQRGKVGTLTYVVSGGGGATLYKARCKKGEKRCKDDGAEVVVSEHHYVSVEVYRDFTRLCPRRVDGTALEECVDVQHPGALK